MKIYRAKLIITFFIATFFCANITFAALPEIITPDQLAKGMRGIGKTVIEGTKIEQFDVEVIGVMQNTSSTGGDLILVRVSGDVINRAGGVAQGMSGSPVFFDGKLAGAVAFGWALSDPDVCLLTPIGQMLDISKEMNKEFFKQQKINQEKTNKKTKELLSNLRKQEDTSEDKQKKQEQKDYIVDYPKNENQALEQKSSFLNLLPKNTPIMVSGFSEQGLNILKEGLKQFNVVPYSVGPAAYNMADVALEPGSSLSIGLMHGDISMGALGTVTWVDGDNVLAFGHPFTKRGSVNYFMSNSYTFTTVSSIKSAFKVGSPGKLLGVGLQDRGAGIAGKLNYYPKIAPMIVTVTDQNTNTTKNNTVQIAQDDMFSPYLAYAAVISFIDRTIDRQGEGTAKVTFTIRAQNLPNGEQIHRENMFYSAKNISEAAASELAMGVNLLATNRFQQVDLTDINVKVEITDQRNTATILSAKTLSKTAKPGETIAIQVVLQPYRGENITKIVQFVVPEKQKDGEMSLSVRGGISLLSLQRIVNQQKTAEASLLLRPDNSKKQTFAEQIEEFNKKDNNNDIIIDLLLGTKSNIKTTATQQKQQQKNTEDSFVEQERQINEFVQGTKYKTNTATNYILTGETTVSIKISSTDNQ